MRLALSELNIELMGETSSDSEGHGLLKDSDLASSETCSSPDCSLISLGFGQQSVAAEMDWDQIGRQVRMEARLMLLVALLPLVSAPWDHLHQRTTDMALHFVPSLPPAFKDSGVSDHQEVWNRLGSSAAL